MDQVAVLKLVESLDGLKRKGRSDNDDTEKRSRTNRIAVEDLWTLGSPSGQALEQREKGK